VSALIWLRICKFKEGNLYAHQDSLTYPLITNDSALEIAVN
jgi:hypothetical protein